MDTGVSKNRGTPKRMVKIMENPMNKWMIWEVKNPIFGLTPILQDISTISYKLHGCTEACSNACSTIATMDFWVIPLATWPEDLL